MSEGFLFFPRIGAVPNLITVKFFVDMGGKISHYIDFESKWLWAALGTVVANPTLWNMIARREYSTRFLSNFTGSAHKACYLLAVSIFSAGLFRDWLYVWWMVVFWVFVGLLAVFILFVFSFVGNNCLYIFCLVMGFVNADF